VRNLSKGQATFLLHYHTSSRHRTENLMHLINPKPIQPGSIQVFLRRAIPTLFSEIKSRHLKVLRLSCSTSFFWENPYYSSRSCSEYRLDFNTRTKSSCYDLSLCPTSSSSSYFFCHSRRISTYANIRDWSCLRLDTYIGTYPTRWLNFNRTENHSNRGDVPYLRNETQLTLK